MMYASKIPINPRPEKVMYHRKVEMPEGYLNLTDISKHLVGDEKFSFQEDTSMFGTTLFMDILGYRLETQEEVEDRVRRAEFYNKKYEEFHIKYPKK